MDTFEVVRDVIPFVMCGGAGVRLAKQKGQRLRIAGNLIVCVSLH